MRTLTNQIRKANAELWRLLLFAHDQKAPRKLGYASWEAYCRDEFGYEHSHAYRLFDAGRRQRELRTAELDTGGPNELQARILTRVRKLDGEEIMLHVARGAIVEGGWREVPGRRLEEIRDKELAAAALRGTLDPLPGRVHEIAGALGELFEPLRGRDRDLQDQLGKLGAERAAKTPAAIRAIRAEHALLGSTIDRFEAALPDEDRSAGAGR